MNCDVKVFVSGSSLKIIEKNAFCNTKLEEIELNDGLETLESGSFGLTPLKKLEIPSSVVNIEFPIWSYGDNITIIGEAGSAAEQFVKESGNQLHLIFQEK